MSARLATRISWTRLYVVTDGTESNCVPPAEAMSVAANSDRTESMDEDCQTTSKMVSPLAMTGMSLATMAGGGLLLMLTGVGLMLATIRRRRLSLRAVTG